MVEKADFGQNWCNFRVNSGKLAGILLREIPTTQQLSKSISEFNNRKMMKNDEKPTSQILYTYLKKKPVPIAWNANKVGRTRQT